MGRVCVLLAVVLAGCGGPKATAPSDAGVACVQAGTDAFCSSTFLCCAQGWCDPVTGHCRAPSQCGLDGQGCDGNHLCCAGLACVNASCTTTSPTGGGTTSTGGSTTVNCAGAAQPCASNSDCCSGVCAGGNHLCANSGSTGTGSGTNSGSGTSTTTGGTCFSQGAGCAASTDCCSGRCNSGVCG